MPIYEYKCLKCQEYFELLVMNKKDEAEFKCPKCNSTVFERIISTTNYAMSDGSAGSKKVDVKTRTCSTGTCTTYTVPGPTR